MCTLTLAWRVFEDAPVVVAANRDESLERDADPPDVYRQEPLTVAPRDRKAGGTWIGYNEFGVFAGITNAWNDADLAGERSRGHLVADVLGAESAAQAGTILEEATATDEYDGFYLVIADADDATCYRWDGELSVTRFDPGVHVVVNVAVDDAVEIPDTRPDVAREQAENARAVRRALSPRVDANSIAETAAEWLERGAAVLSDHEYGVCIHGDGFGTRSSSLITIGERTSYRFAPGPPCRTAYETVDVGSRSTSDIEGHI
ncbi:NRDE family protein [Natrarchaeobius sp. A-rgal3]|uniref:NRDE family protein n=1 Tax=Natrarchaeobius versutus TaxID=1679078 RepID=UPI0035104E4B